MHDRGLNFGIYEDYGTKTCGGFPGSYGYVEKDAQTFAEWDVDYLKLDGCNIDEEKMPAGYAQMERALNATGRQIVYSCSWPAYLIDHPEKVDYKLIGKSCNLWRNFDDINSSWGSIRSIIDYYDHNQDKHIPSHGPGHWHDPDMLVIGNSGITEDMAITQMSIWSIWSAPLIMSNDLRTIAPKFAQILQNRDVIAINQDPLGIMGRLVANTTDIGVYAKQVLPGDGQSYSYAVAVFNRNTNYAQDVSFYLKDIGLKSSSGYLVEDLWDGVKYGILRPDDKFSTRVRPTSTTLIKATLVDTIHKKPQLLSNSVRSAYNRV
ncbi:unnamed protein product, partial [Mesorhabditis belari]|uniref:Alpha-galactosidase n=1 Tax=Mesorhabditis belari TaxID=2138241 RepID=A0AAF3FQ21_9BILA